MMVQHLHLSAGQPTPERTGGLPSRAARVTSTSACSAAYGSSPFGLGAASILLVLCTMAGCAGTPAASAGAALPRGGGIDQVMRYLGNFHPASIHFPIVLIVLAGIAEFVALLRGDPFFQRAGQVCIFGGALSALACVCLGLGVAKTAAFGDMSNPVLVAHGGLGSATAGLSIVAVGLSLRLRPTAILLRRVYRLVLLMCALSVGGAGFLGGALVYGIDHYSARDRSLDASMASSSLAPPASPTVPATGGSQSFRVPTLTFPKGAATPSETCAKCHKSIYREFAFGEGSDLAYRSTTLTPTASTPLSLPPGTPRTATAHAFAGIDPWPIHARASEEEGKSCNVCHFPQPFEIPGRDIAATGKPIGRTKEKETGGLTCASCHLTPEGKIRGPYAVQAPHATIQEPEMRGSAMCAYCHSFGRRVVGKQTQTFLEWREDFAKPGLGTQQCQDCHMPRTVRKLADANADVPERVVARHLWTGGHSFQRVQSALALNCRQPSDGKPYIELDLSNVGAGHSVPTGSNRRAVYLIADVADGASRLVASRRWMFAPWYGDRPDDRAFLQEDAKRKDAVAAAQADAQGPHESSIRAGERRVLAWNPELPAGRYTLTARVIYDLNRYNEPGATDDQTEIQRMSLPLVIR